MIRHRDLRATVVAAVACAVAALVVPIDWLSLVLLAPLAFFLTGYALVAAAFVAGPQPWPRAFWLSLGLSLATLALLPLPLNYLGGLTPGTWAAGLVIVVLLACRVAARRRPVDWSGPAPTFPRRSKRSALAALIGLGAAVLIAAAIILAHTPLANEKALGFTELWMRPAAGGTQVRIGVGNQEQHWTTFVVQAKFAGGPAVKRTLSLYPGSRSTFDLDVLPQPTPGNPTFVSVVLSRQPEESDHPFRRVYGWIPAGAEE